MLELHNQKDLASWLVFNGASSLVSFTCHAAKTTLHLLKIPLTLKEAEKLNMAHTDQVRVGPA